MNRTFIEVPLFSKRWIEIGLTDTDLFELQLVLLDNPDLGRVIEGTGGIRKLRFSLPHRGKRGSVRVCYVDFAEFGTIYLITAYKKSEQEDLTDSEKNVLKGLVKQLKEEARRNNRRYRI